MNKGNSLLSDTPLAFCQVFLDLKPDHLDFKGKNKYVPDSYNALYYQAVSELNELDRLYTVDEPYPEPQGTSMKQYPFIISRNAALSKREQKQKIGPGWSYFPTIRQREYCSQYSLDAQLKHRMRTMLADYATNDLHFAIGG